jgi:hypothetical protein
MAISRLNGGCSRLIQTALGQIAHSTEGFCVFIDEAPVYPVMLLMAGCCLVLHT